MARTKQTARKATMGAPTLSQKGQQGLGIEEAKSQGQMENPGGTGQVLLHYEKSEDIKNQLNS